MNFSRSFLEETAEIAMGVDAVEIERMVGYLNLVRGRGGRVFCIGLGGGASNASHAAADLRNLCDIEAYAPLDNLTEVTSLANDGSWEDVIISLLTRSRFSGKDALTIFSVGGGDEEKNVSMPIAVAAGFARAVGAIVLGIVGPNGGATRDLATCCVTIPARERVTPHTESFQAVIWHLLVSHPLLARKQPLWEGFVE